MPFAFNLDLSLAVHRSGGTAGFGIRATPLMNGDNFIVDLQSVGTSAELIGAGDVTGANALLILKNSDATNFVTLYADGAGGTYPFGILYPGQFAVLFSIGTPAIGAKADTAPINLSKVILENVDMTTAGLEWYDPTKPELGKARARFSLNINIGGTTVSVLEQYEETILGSGMLDYITATITEGDLWPTTAGPIGGNSFGTFVALNASATDYSIIRATTGAQNFANIPLYGGFCLLPMNGGNLRYTASSAHSESRMVTRKQI